MHLLVKNTIVIFFVGIPLVFYGQQGGKSITGKIIDSQTALPVPFATIKLKTKMMGVVSNANGDFQIPLTFRDLSDSIVVSCIGYSTTALSFRDLDEYVLNIIKVKPSIQSLGEVVVFAKKRFSASKILRMAIENLPDNYPQVPYSYIAYYRDYQQLDTSYLNLNEAIVEIFDAGFHTNDLQNTKILVYEYKENKDFQRDTTKTVPYDNKPGKFGHGKNKYIPNAILSPFGGNELSILRLHDALRNNNQFSYSFINVFIQDFETNHFLKLEVPVNLDTISLYCLSFESRYSASGSRNFSKGKIYIEKGNFAIHKIEYSTYNKTMKETQLMYEIQTEYARNGPVMYLNYISFANQFKTQNDTNFKVIEILYHKEKNAFVLDFNTVPEKTSVLDTSNYEFIIEDKLLTIRMVHMTGERQATLFLNDASGVLLSVYGDEISSKLKLRTKNIRDIDNRELDKVSTSLFQFRELFVQKLFANKTPPSSLQFASKNIPLSNSSVDGALKENSNFWMNSPLKKKE